MGAGEGSWPCRSTVTWGSPHPDHPAEYQTPGFNHCASLSWMSLRNLFSRVPNPIVLSSTPPPPTAFSNSPKAVTSTQVPTGNLEAALDIPFHTVYPAMSIVTATCQFYCLISICTLFTIPAVYTPSQATPPPFLAWTFLGTLHSYTPYIIRGCLEKHMLSLCSCPEPFCGSPLPLESRPESLPLPSRPALPLFPAELLFPGSLGFADTGPSAGSTFPPW